MPTWVHLVYSLGCMMEQNSQQKTLGMERGLFLIKYESSDNADSPPSVAFSAEQGSEGAVELILPPMRKMQSYGRRVQPW